MIKSRKLLTVVSLILGVSMLAACSNTQVNNGDDEKLTEPEYETQEMSVAVLGEGESIIIDGYEIMEFPDTGYYVSRPVIKNKMKGVEYIGDNNWDADKEYYQNINRPDGTENTLSQGNYASIMFTYQPDYGYNKDSAERAKEMSPLSFEFYRKDIIGIDEKDQQKQFRDCDVRAVSFALYEEFYENRPELKLKVYGIPRSVWESEIGDDMIFKFADYQGFYKKCKENGYSQCTLLEEKDIDATGVYYIDYTELDKRGDFMQYVVVGEFSWSGIYSYYVNVYSAYNIMPKEVEAYKSWKQANIDKFIAGK